MSSNPSHFSLPLFCSLSLTLLSSENTNVVMFHYHHKLWVWLYAKYCIDLGSILSWWRRDSSLLLLHITIYSTSLIPNIWVPLIESSCFTLRFIHQLQNNHPQLRLASANCKILWKSRVYNSTSPSSQTNSSWYSQMLQDWLNTIWKAPRCSETTFQCSIML